MPTKNNIKKQKKLLKSYFNVDNVSDIRDNFGGDIPIGALGNVDANNATTALKTLFEDSRFQTDFYNEFANYKQTDADSGDAIKEKNLKEKVGSDKGKLIPTDVGMVVNDFLVNHFSSILDYNFTAKVERDFDEIAEGQEDWTNVMKEFYDEFHPRVEDVAQNAEREVGERILGEDPDSGKPVSVRLGKFGPMVQIGTVEDEDKPRFASLAPGQTLGSITFEQAMDLFQLPKELGDYKGETVTVNNGRFGPYVKFGAKFVSLDKGEDPLSTSLERAMELIDAKEKADAPIYTYEDLPVQKGTGRFGPFIKWNGMFINVNKKYDFDNLSDEDIVQLIEEKKQKEIDKVIHNWEEEGIRVEKARWGRSNILKGKIKIDNGIFWRLRITVFPPFMCP
jgi:DNA topoisomerase-1